jgi:hypothetical protein
MTRHITWEVFSIDYIEPGVPGKFRLEGIPSVIFYVSDKAQRIGIKIYVDAHTRLPDSLLKELTLELKADENGFYADFCTTNSALFEHFYSMMCFISDIVQLKNINIVDAINQAVQRLKSLISSKQLLSEEKIIGIWGELWMLEWLIKEKGSKAVFYWKGSDKAIHDFRMREIELEVKTTRNEDRVHIISRLSQLEESPNLDLYLCSIQLVEGSTEGLTLGEYVVNINELLRSDSEAISQFEKQLNKEGYELQQSAHYSTRYYLRSIPSIILITDNFPRIIRNTIDVRYGSESSCRISNVHYNIDVTGLGVEINDSDIKKLLDKEK